MKKLLFPVKLLFAVCCCLFIAHGAQAQTQKNEFSVTVGGGSLQGENGSVVAAPVFTVAYTRGLTEQDRGRRFARRLLRQTTGHLSA